MPRRRKRGNEKRYFDEPLLLLLDPECELPELLPLWLCERELAGAFLWLWRPASACCALVPPRVLPDPVLPCPLP